MNSRYVLACALTLLTGCDALKDRLGGKADAGRAGQTGATAAKSSSDAADAGRPEQENLLSAAAGAMIVEEPAAKNNYDPWNLLDDAPSYWQVQEAGTYTLVLSVPQPTTVKTLLWRGGAKKVIVEATASPNAKDGYQKIAEATLGETETNHSTGGGALQPVPVTKALSARAFRITMEAPKQYTQSNDLIAYGTKDGPATFPVPNLTGTYGPMEESLGDLRIKQQGTSISGCVANMEFSGEIDGGLVKGRWWKTVAKEDGPAAFNVTPDGSKLVFFRYAGSAGTLFARMGPKKSGDAGTCPSWKTEAAPVDPIAAEIERFGRARIYGIRFDTDSDVIKPESKAVIDRVVAVLKAKPDWKMLVEGHTDDTATPPYNQTLSDKRASAVKKALEAQGIAAARLTAKGFGQTKPVAPNETSIGRAENRRVELAKQ